MSRQIPIEKLTPGMVLAEDVRRPDGALVAARGTVVTGRHAAFFTTHHVVSVSVEGAAEEPAAAEPPAEPPMDPLVLEAARDHVRSRFALAGGRQPALAELAKLCVPRVARAMVRQKTAFPDPPPRPPAVADPQDAQARRTPPSIQDVIAADPSLVSLPDVFARICEVLNNPVSTAQEAARVIGMDQSLSARLLRLVNSAFYGFPTKVDTLSRAVTIVGSRQLTTLALGISVVSLFRDLPPGLTDVKSVWKHSVACGLAASALAGCAACAPDSGERLFVAGLLHDVGRLVMYRNLPEFSGQALALARREKNLLRPAEVRVFGFDHAALGQALLAEWRFPETLALAVGHHHGPGRRGWTPDTAIVHVADVVVNALRLGSSGEYYVPPLSPDAFAVLGVPVSALGQAVDKVDRQVEAVLSVFMPDEAKFA
ncbi:HDOD domain-containing protein [Desulfovibrio sulfodismutans]|uniref:HDOD domain-containing protein n=1 Tax=Desulfolutivibrio sulfodismutans TaxID=63561 RepID=A0A7K3NH06_9BACT|nr:HDOD domain-containing protein [Desulfolutivibrio sulfodismutans]NDY55484.1 HDOD domain-containing protein [Desulfolutivibrio sulfodismutans]QLA12872.1 HDOD domain-containing protein [Desulfolutivibrio sulfodismutans DSM 3696]